MQFLNSFLTCPCTHDLRLQHHLGKDLAPHVLAGEVARKLKTEAQRLGSQAAATAELAAAAAQEGVRRE